MAEVKLQMLEERNRRRGIDLPEIGVDPVRKEVDDSSYDNPDQYLTDDLVSTYEALGFLTDHFEIVIEKPYPTEGCVDREDQDNIHIADIRPQQGRHENGDQHNETTHRRCTRLGEM